MTMSKSERFCIKDAFCVFYCGQPITNKKGDKKGDKKRDNWSQERRQGRHSDQQATNKQGDKKETRRRKTRRTRCPTRRQTLLKALRTRNLTLTCLGKIKKEESAYIYIYKTYLPHKAVWRKFPKIRNTYRKGACGVQLVRKSIDVRFKRVESQMTWLSSDLRFK